MFIAITLSMLILISCSDYDKIDSLKKKYCSSSFTLSSFVNKYNSFSNYAHSINSNEEMKNFLVNLYITKEIKHVDKVIKNNIDYLFIGIVGVVIMLSIYYLFD